MARTIPWKELPLSRSDTDAARLRRLRRLAARRGLAILAAARPASKVAGGGYMLSDEATRRVVLGDKPLPYSASLEAIEAQLEADDEGHGG